MRYFAYGSNLNPEVLEKKGVAYSVRERATLRDYRLLFNKKALRHRLPENIGFANIEPASGHVVEGALYKIADEDLDRLDASERYPDHYTRIPVTVETAAGRCSCFTYQAQPEKTQSGLIPSRNYINHILIAEDLFSPEYCETLRKTRTYSGECACCHRVTDVLFLKERDNLYSICAACREAKQTWGDARGKPFTILDTEVVMQHVLSRDQGFPSITELIDEAIALHLIQPR